MATNEIWYVATMPLRHTLRHCRQLEEGILRHEILGLATERDNGRTMVNKSHDNLEGKAQEYKGRRGELR